APPAPILYDHQVIRQRGELVGKEKKEPQLQDIKQVFSRTVTKNPDGTLSIDDALMGDESFYSDRAAPPDSTVGPAEPPRKGALITARGERLNEPDGADMDLYLSPVFPAEEIKPGHTWQSHVEFPPSSG